jgi:predicted amidohydrolase YtcJ
VIDIKGRRVIPGLIDSHMHIIRGGLNFNMELRWDGVPSLSEAMAMLKAQVDRTPPRNGCAWWAALPNTSLPKSACPRLPN